MSKISGHFAYVCHGKKRGHTLSQFSMNEDGTFSPLAVPPFASGSFPEAIVADAQKEYLYVLHHHATQARFTGYVACLKNNDGLLERMPNRILTVGQSPSRLVIDPLNRCLYVVRNGHSYFRNEHGIIDLDFSHF